MKSKTRLIIHAGMHKTGSTSIQFWLRNAKLEDAHYFNWDTPNHSTLFTLLFEEKPYEYFGLKRRGLTEKNTENQRRKALDGLIRELETTNASIYIFSAERISSASDNSVYEMERFFSQYFEHIDVFAYVRQPTGFMTSMFQQHLKTWGPKLKVRQLWPEYKRRFLRLDKAFGQEKVHLRRYEDLKDKKTDAVADFLDWTGVKGVGEAAVRRNTSMKSDAVALLYVYRTYVTSDLEEKPSVSRDNQVVQEIREVGGERFILNLPTDPDFDRKRRIGMRWISNRMGLEINDLDEEKLGIVVFRSDADLRRAAILASYKLDPTFSTLDPDDKGSFDETIARLRSILAKTGKPTERAKFLVRRATSEREV